ncbi:MAG: LptA/OstA family protein [Pseudomonadota bacterium]
MMKPFDILRTWLFGFFLCFALTGIAQAQSFGGAFEGVGDNDKPIQIEADSLEIIDDQNTALLTGNVSVVQGSTILKAKRIKVFYLRKGEQGQSKSGIRKIEASGTVAVRSQDNYASADNAIVDMVSEIVTMNGNVFISQGKNVANGCKLTVNLKTSVSEIKPCGSSSSSGSGRVKLLLDPKSRNTN